MVPCNKLHVYLKLNSRREAGNSTPTVIRVALLPMISAQQRSWRLIKGNGNSLVTTTNSAARPGLLPTDTQRCMQQICSICLSGNSQALPQGLHYSSCW